MRHDGWDQSRPDIVDKPITASATRCKSFRLDFFFLRGGRSEFKSELLLNYEKKKRKKKKFSPAQMEEDERYEGI